jgi:hypothetical protein
VSSQEYPRNSSEKILVSSQQSENTQKRKR